MQVTSEQSLPQLGQVEFKVHNGSRYRQQIHSQFKLACSAVALDDDQILLLSVAGPETSVKALLAGLRSSQKEQQRISYAVHFGDELNRSDLSRCPDGYRVFRVKLGYA